LSSMSEAVTALHNQFADDWRIPLEKGLNHIIDKPGNLAEFYQNKHQQRFNDMKWEKWSKGEPFYAVELKCRQYGASTKEATTNYDICAFVPGTRCLMLSNIAKNSAKIFNMLKLNHEEFNPLLRTEAKSNNANIFEFTNHSRIEVDTAENRRAGMGGTYQIVHASEVAHYTDPEKTMGALLAAVPKQGRTIVVVESTANGVGNYYHKLVMDAYHGKNNWTLFFVPWHEHDEYAMKLPTGYVFKPEVTGQYGNEVELQRQFNLSPEQLYWRRFVLANECQYDLSFFQQEYPATVEEAFIGSGLPVFNHHKLSELEPKITAPPQWRGYLDRYIKDKPIVEQIHLNTDGMGSLRVWDKPEPSKYDNRYIISADTGGVWTGADYSCAYVLDRVKGRVSAMLHGHINAYEYADQLQTLSLYYNNALIIPEINRWSSETDDQGETLVEYLRKRGLHLYTRKIQDDLTKEWTTKIGFHTNGTTKGMIVDRLIEFVNEWADNPIYCNDIDLINEMRTYIISETKTGKRSWQAQDGCKDDRVMAFGIALVVAEELGAVKLRAKINVMTPMNDDPIMAFG
jgi:hypothetical protein